MGTSEAPVPAGPTFGPVPRGERLVSIDFVRGVALLGILLVNTASFFAPMAESSSPKFVGAQEAHDRLARLLVTAFCFTKFISIFGMLFGYGLLTQLDRVSASGHSTWGFAARRLGTLAAIGLLHALALWYGDILFVYATLGVFVVIFRPVKPRDLLILALVFLVYYSSLRILGEIINVYAADFQPPARGRAARNPDAPQPRGGQAIVRAGLNPFSEVWVNAEKTAGREGPYGDLLTFRLTMWAYQMISMAFGSWCLVVGLFLMGMWLYRVGFFAPEQAPLRRKTFFICLPTGLAIEAVAALFYHLGATGNHLLWGIGGGIQAFSIFFLPLGYVSGLALLADALPRWLTSPVTCAGRMALTVYLSETVIATTLSYFYGFGWFGEAKAAEQVLIAFCIWAALVAFSRLWLFVFAMGPMEWLWRLVEYGWRRSGTPTDGGGAGGAVTAGHE